MSGSADRAMDVVTSEARSLRADDVPRRTLWRQQAVVGDQLLLLDTVEEHLHVLSASAGLIYTSVDGISTVGQIVEALSADLGLDEAVLDGDIVGGLADLLAEGLITTTAGSGRRDGHGELPSEAGAGLSREDLRSRSVLARERRARWDGARRRRLNESGSWPIELGPFLVGAATTVVRMDDPAVAALLADALDLLPPAPAGSVVDEHLSVVQERSGAGRWRVYLGGVELVKATSVEGAAEAVLSGCNRAATQHPVGAIRFHGGVVERNGRAVVICGVSGAGKSTLTTGLVSDGWRYLSDEVAIVDPRTLIVTPYPKWIDLVPESLERAGLDRARCVGPSGRKHHVPPSLVGAVGSPAHVVLVVMLVAPGTDHPSRPEPVVGVDAVRLALGNVFATSWDTLGGLQSLADLCSRASVVTMRRDMPDEMTSQVMELWRR